jgi:hypothetical protein
MVTAERGCEDSRVDDRRERLLDLRVCPLGGAGRDGQIAVVTIESASTTFTSSAGLYGRRSDEAERIALRAETRPGSVARRGVEGIP